jgi:hypothetical protein
MTAAESVVGAQDHPQAELARERRRVVQFLSQ